MKRILTALLAVFILVSLTACYPEDTGSLHTTGETGETENVTTDNWNKETDASTENTEPEQEAPTEPDSSVDETESTEPDEEEEAPSPEQEEPEDPIEPEKPADPVEPGKPENPVEPEDPPHTHSYHTSITKATCTKSGIKTFTCACGDSYTETISATGHSYKSSITRKATCTESGVKTFTCACGDSYTENISATGHDWGDWKTVTEPTVSSEGVSQKQCKTCKKTESKPIEKLPAKVTVTQAQLQAIENQFLALVNLERNRVGVGALSINAHLDSGAQIRSQEIVGSFSHTRPNGASFSSVVDSTQYPYSVLGENLAMTSHVGSGYYYPDQDRWVGSDAQIEQAAAWIFTILKNSPGHYENMIKGNYQHCGIGISYTVTESDIPYFYVAHIFGGQT